MRAAEFDQANVFVVGGSTGIGLAAAQHVARLGAHVTLFARREAPLRAAAESLLPLRRYATQRVAWRGLDVADATAVRQVMAELVLEHGAPRVLLNCAGRAIPRRFEEISDAQLAETLQVNFVGSWNTIQALLPSMRAHGAGYIVNTSSLAGLIGVFGYTDYSASKFALIGFSEALRSEVKPHGLWVSVLCPPDTDTPGLAAEDATKPEETRAISANASVLSAEAVATVLFQGMARKRFLIIPGIEGRASAWAKRLAPSLIERVMDRAIAKVARQRRGARSGTS